MLIRVVPGQHEHRWCCRCRRWSALEVGVYDSPDLLIGTFVACTVCDPDVFRPPADDSDKEVGGG